ncbi:hypothetical protein [Streptomyces beigongshangae]|uniref:hypothetical protein n=1 Tax=Streptomyces beigongshangae TaxID=2841597 RepID=UPI001C849326|nr:hypothetical protein [Streptomyces sp. REN17]
MRSDNTGGMRSGHLARARERDIELWITVFPGTEGVYELMLKGSRLPNGNSCWAQASGAKELSAAMHRLRKEWETQIHKRRRRTPKDDRATWQPFFHEVDLTRTRFDPWQDMLPALARAGRDTFDMLFADRGAGSPMAALRKELHGLLCRPVRPDPGHPSGTDPGYRITVRPRNFFAPWPLLCVPPPESEKPDKHWFLGYRHQIEVRTWDNDNVPVQIPVRPDGRPRVAAIVDHTLDEDLAEGSTFAPVRSALHGRAVLEEYESHERVEELLRDAPADLHFLYLSCHCDYSDEDGPLLYLNRYRENAQQLGFREAASWGTGPSTPKMALLNTCRGGRPTQRKGRGFVDGLKGIGWFSALAAPETEVPVRFLGDYGKRFFDGFLDDGPEGGVDVGTLVQEMAREFLDERGNPLALLYCVHRNLETHLCREEQCPMTHGRHQ